MTISFSPNVFARIEPDLYLQRHLSQNVRPSGLRHFDEFFPTTAQIGNLNGQIQGHTKTIGSAVVRSSGNIVACGITVGVTSSINGGGIFPNVEVARGSARLAPPSGEEMIISQTCYQRLRFLQRDASRYFSLDDKFRIKFPEFPDINDRYFVILASVQVLSRSGPCLDVVWNCIAKALQDTKLPTVTIDYDTMKTVIGDEEGVSQLAIDELPLSYSCGVVTRPAGESENNHGPAAHGDNIVLAQIDGVVEESTVRSRISLMMGSQKDEYHAISIVSGNDGVSVIREDIEKAMGMSTKVFVS